MLYSSLSHAVFVGLVITQSSPHVSETRYRGKGLTHHHASIAKLLYRVHSTKLFRGEILTTVQQLSCYERAIEEVIKPNQQLLSEVHQEYRLDVLLSAMLDHAPHPSGRRYVAVVLVAQELGISVVVSVAESWMDCLFLRSK